MKLWPAVLDYLNAKSGLRVCHWLKSRISTLDEHAADTTLKTVL